MRRPPLLAVFLLLAGAGLVGWNASRFIGAKQQPRTKDLDFLPSAAAAKLMALGHSNTAAKLRWIDSFAYFEFQLDRLDDTIGATGESAFLRLYRMLITLDPHFLPYYQHASLNLGGVLGHHDQVLPLLEQGLLSLPHESSLWRMIAAELVATDKLEERNPVLMDALLTAWHDAETTDEGRQQVWDWKKAMARRQYRDLRQLPYWEEQLRTSAPGSASREFILNTMREQVARFGVEQLALLVEACTRNHGTPPFSIQELLDPGIVTEVWPHGPPPYAPIALVGGMPCIRPDPFGYPYALLAGKAVSPGWESHRLKQRATLMGLLLAKVATRIGQWPASLEEAKSAGLELDVPPPGCRWELDGKSISLVVDPPPLEPWDPLGK